LGAWTKVKRVSANARLALVEWADFDTGESVPGVSLKLQLCLIRNQFRVFRQAFFNNTAIIYGYLETEQNLEDNNTCFFPSKGRPEFWAVPGHSAWKLYF
jgi:hypothetical protein